LPSLACVASLAITLLGRAEDPAEAPRPISIAYEASESCPAAGDFLARLRELAPRVPVVEPNRADRRYRIRLVGEASGFRGTIFEQPAAAAEVAVRDAEAPSCSELADALALIVAIAADPSAAGGRLPPPAPVASFAATPPPPPPPASAPPAPPEPPPPRPPDNGPNAAPKPWHLDIGAAGSMLIGLGPDPLAAVPVSLSLYRGDARGSSLGVSFVRPWTAHVSGVGSDGSASWTFVGLRFCQSLYAPGDASWSLGGCAETTAGALHAEGATTDHGGTKPWWAAGLGGRVVYSPATWLSFGAYAGVFAPISRYYLYAGSPEKVVYSIPYIGAYGVLGIGARAL
jgi:hypothetical protein